MDIDAFMTEAPSWTQSAVHVQTFSCPACQAGPGAAEAVWINRRSPVYAPEQRRKWQEFYHCGCGQAWWAWSNDRPPSDLQPQSED